MFLFKEVNIYRRRLLAILIEPICCVTVTSGIADEVSWLAIALIAYKAFLPRNSQFIPISIILALIASMIDTTLWVFQELILFNKSNIGAIKPVLNPCYHLFQDLNYVNSR